MNICGYIPESINEGPGLRAAIFISGCRHYCKNCFSPKTWNFHYGTKFTEEKQREIISEIVANPLLDGVTILGGDPFFSAREVSGFLDLLVHENGRTNIWIYSGFTFEELTTDPKSARFQLLKRCDILVDGRFIEKERDLSLLYRGSRNQRLVDVAASLQKRQVVEWKPRKIS